MVPDTEARLAKLRQIVLQKRNKPRSVSPSASDYSDYSDTDSAGAQGDQTNSIWDADRQVPPGQWEVPPGPRHDSYEPEGFAFPHFHPAHPVHPPHFLPAYPVHHMPPHFHQPELYGFAPRHPYEWHGLPPQEMEERDNAQSDAEDPPGEKPRSAKGEDDPLRRKAWKRLPDGPLEEQEPSVNRRARLQARADHVLKERREGMRTIKISNVPKSVSLKHLQELFATVGQVKHSKMDGNGEAFLTFDQAHHAAKAAELFSEGTLDGHTIEAIYPCEADLTTNLASNMPSAGYTDAQAVVAEAMGTFLLCFTVWESAVSPVSSCGRNACIAISGAVFVSVLTLLPVTGCSINPARSFGPAIMASLRGCSNYTAGGLEALWIMFVGPFLGAAFATLAHHGFIPLPVKEGEPRTPSGEVEKDVKEEGTTIGPRVMDL